jgi:NADH dehydrogenase
VKGLQLSGFPAWLLWLGVHLFYLIGFQNRLLVLLRWGFSFATRGRGARIITETTVPAADGAQPTEPEVAARDSTRAA